MGPNVFPPQIPDELLKIPVESYYSEVLGLSCKVLEILAKGLPYGDDVFAPFISQDPVCAVRLLHYPPQPPGDHRQLGAGAHTDFGEPISAARDVSACPRVRVSYNANREPSQKKKKQAPSPS